jgi:hypothetical protein
MTLLPPQITARLKKAGTAAYTIRAGDGVQGPRTRQYQALIEEIDAATAEARRLVPELYRKGETA